MLPMFLVMTAPISGLLLLVILPAGVALPLYALGVLLALWAHVLMRRAHTRPVATGARGMLGSTAEVVGWQGNRGIVRYEGELWRARSSSGDQPAAGATVRVLEVEDLTLVVGTEHATLASVICDTRGE